MTAQVSFEPGYIVEERVRCGKPGCRCARGQLHGPYHYLRWRRDGVHHRKYICPAELDRIRAGCQARAGLREELRQTRRYYADLYEQFAELAREIEEEKATR